MVDASVLKDIQFFKEFTMTNSLLSPVLSSVRILIGVGDTIFKEQEEGTALYILKKGEVKACRMGPNGELVTLTLMKEGEIFGEMSFLDGSVRSASIVAISPVEAYMLDKPGFESHRRRPPEGHV